MPTDTIVTISFNRPMIPLTALDNQPDAEPVDHHQPRRRRALGLAGYGGGGLPRRQPASCPASDYTVAVKAGWPDSDGRAAGAGHHVPLHHDQAGHPERQPVQRRDRAWPLDAPLVVRFNMPMDHDSVQRRFTPHVSDRNAALPGTYRLVARQHGDDLHPGQPARIQPDLWRWSSAGRCKPATRQRRDLAGTANAWEFSTTEATHVSGHHPDNSDDGPAQPATSFGFSFNNPLAPDQNVAPIPDHQPGAGGLQGPA